MSVLLALIALQSLPAPLELEAPIERWDEALPLGNGMTGALVWGAGNELVLSLDRADLWDLRTPRVYEAADWNYASLRAAVAAGDQAGISERFDEPYVQLPYPTKLPAGRVVLTLEPGSEARRFVLDLAGAEARVEYAGNLCVRAFTSASEPVTLVEIPGPAPGIEIVRPSGLDRLGYGAGVRGEQGELRWLVQHGVPGSSWAVVVGAREARGTTTLALAITSSRVTADPLAQGRERVTRALDLGYAAAREPHRAWWRDFHGTSSLRVPDPELQAQLELACYLYGAGSRRGAPPMPLQGVWTADEGGLPPGRATTTTT